MAEQALERAEELGWQGRGAGSAPTRADTIDGVLMGRCEDFLGTPGEQRSGPGPNGQREEERPEREKGDNHRRGRAALIHRRRGEKGRGGLEEEGKG